MIINSAWYVVLATPSKEKIAMANLSREGFVSIYPRVKFGNANPVPLFTRYIFVWINKDDLWQQIYRMHGVSRIIGGENPSPMKSGWVERLSTNLIDGVFYVKNPSELLEFVPGQTLHIIEGIFSGRMAICLWSSVSSVVVDLMEGQITGKTRLPVSSVEAYPKPETIMVLPQY